MPSEEQFDWSAENVDLILQEQRRTAVYKNELGSIVIRQEAGGYETEDPYIVVTTENLPALIRRLQEISGT